MATVCRSLVTSHGSVCVPGAHTGPSRGRCALVTGAASVIGAATVGRLAAEVRACCWPGSRPPRTSAPTAAAPRTSTATSPARSPGTWSRGPRTRRSDRSTRWSATRTRCTSPPVHATDPAEWNPQLAVILTGSFLGFRARLANLRATGGSVVPVASVHAWEDHPAAPPTRRGRTDRADWAARRRVRRAGADPRRPSRPRRSAGPGRTSGRGAAGPLVSGPPSAGSAARPRSRRPSRSCSARTPRS